MTTPTNFQNSKETCSGLDLENGHGWVAWLQGETVQGWLADFTNKPLGTLIQPELMAWMQDNWPMDPAGYPVGVHQLPTPQASWLWMMAHAVSDMSKRDALGPLLHPLQALRITREMILMGDVDGLQAAWPHQPPHALTDLPDLILKSIQSSQHETVVRWLLDQEEPMIETSQYLFAALQRETDTAGGRMLSELIARTSPKAKAELMRILDPGMVVGGISAWEERTTAVFLSLPEDLQREAAAWCMAAHWRVRCPAVVAWADRQALQHVVNQEHVKSRLGRM